MPLDSIPNTNNIGVISMHEFLDFLKITCQVNESIIDGKSSTTAAAPINDYNELAKNELVNNLLSKQHTIGKSVETTDELKEGVQEISTKPNPMKEKSREKSIKKRLQNSRSQKSKSEVSEHMSQLDPALSEKLNEVINEGILDSVLPFVCPINSNSQIILNGNTLKNAKPSNTNVSGNIRIQPQQVFDFKPPSANSQQPTSETTNGGGDGVTNSNSKRSPRLGENSSNNNLALPGRSARRKSISPMSTGDSRGGGGGSTGGLGDAEVVIHVCDEVKSVSRDFMCPQKLLVSKMGYFADVTSGSKQRLEDMDISVHCDLQIFEWLMKWVKREGQPPEDSPTLDATNVVPILVSASFLQMEPLLLDCLSFCHSRLNDVVRVSANLSCLNDGIITRLAAMFTNLELELVKDKKDRVAPRLWTKLIQSLSEPEAQSLRGNYATLAGLFKCSKCGKYLTPSVSTYVYCQPQNMRLNRWGQLISQHTRDTGWSVTNYVATLYKDLKSWRKVYWKLWGHCHFLYCVVCETHFPTYQMLWCQYHPDQPQFLGPVTEGRTAGPGGRFPCCNQQAFRFETFPGPTGCQYREHTVQIENERDRAILQLSHVAAEGGCLHDDPPIKPTNTTGEPWWSGIAILPHRSRQGLLPAVHIEENYTRGGKPPANRNNRQNSIMFETSSDSDSSGDNVTPIPRRYSSSSDGGESDENSPKQYRTRRSKRHVKMSCGRYWSGDVSARSNQDNQREFEERAMKQVIAMVGKKNGGDVNVQYQNYQHGGSYIKLESEWKESLKLRNSTKPKK